LHVGFWLPPGACLENIESLWLKATGEQNDPHAQEYAVIGRRIEQNEAGWAVYMAMHDGAHKAAQLGWKGKQWGVWNRAAFKDREPESVVMNEREHTALLGLLAEHDRQKKSVELWKKIAAACGEDNANIYANPDSLPLRQMHRGNLLWCLDAVKVHELIARAKLLAAEPT
jgi:hypothetical protein